MCLNCRILARVGFSAIALLIAFCGYLIAAPPTMRAHYIDVGQGASTLLEFPCGLVLIDTGSDKSHEEAAAKYLTKVFERRSDLHETISLIIITHPHLDHTMGLRKVVESFRVLNYVDDGILTGSGRANVNWIRNQGRGSIAIRPVSDSEITELPHKHGLTDDAIDPVKCPDCDPKIVILSASMDENPGWSSKEFNNLNNHSVVTRVDFGEASFLFTGDLEIPGIQTLVNYYRNTNMLDVDVWQVGHHGSYNGTNEALLEAMTPQIAVIGDGEWTDGQGDSGRFNTFSFGHPRLQTIDLLSAAIPGHRSPPIKGGVAAAVKDFGFYNVRNKIYATGWDHDVVVEATLDGHFQVTPGPTVKAPDNPVDSGQPDDTDPNQPPSTGAG